MRRIIENGEVIHVSIDKEEMFNFIMEGIKNKTIDSIPEEINMIDDLTEEDVYISVSPYLDEMQRYALNLALSHRN